MHLALPPTQGMQRRPALVVRQLGHVSNVTDAAEGPPAAQQHADQRVQIGRVPAEPATQFMQRRVPKIVLARQGLGVGADDRR